MDEIRWAPRVSMDDIRRLYESDAAGMRDDELLCDVGWSIYARAQSVIDVNRAHDEHIANCPVCGGDAPLSGEIGSGAEFVCACGWRADWEAYHRSYKGRQLTGSTVVPFAREFMSAWRRAGDNGDARLRAIDALIHRFHWEMEGHPARPVAVNFIDGRLPQVFHLMLELAHSGTPEWERERRVWDKNVAIFRDTIYTQDRYIEKPRRR